METGQIRILLAEDDLNLGKILKSYLELKGYKTSLYPDGLQALEAFKTEEFDFCILDIMMPVMDGFKLAEEIRHLNDRIPILFLSAKTLEEDKRTAYNIGADDYITKPFSMEELILKIEAISRRCNPYDSKLNNTFSIGKYSFDYIKLTLYFEDKTIKLTSREADLLKLLCINKNDILDRRVALKKIWLDDTYFNARSMDVYISRLRNYLKHDKNVGIINVHGIGFRLVEGLEENTSKEK